MGVWETCVDRYVEVMAAKEKEEVRVDALAICVAMISSLEK